MHAVWDGPYFSISSSTEFEPTCFAALVQQDVFALARRYGAAIDWAAFAELFRRRVTDLSLKIPRTMEANFVEPTTPEAYPIRQHIDQYRCVPNC